MKLNLKGGRIKEKQGEQEMSSYRKELHFNLPTRRELDNIMRNVEKALAEIGTDFLRGYWLK